MLLKPQIPMEDSNFAWLAKASVFISRDVCIDGQSSRLPGQKHHSSTYRKQLYSMARESGCSEQKGVMIPHIPSNPTYVSCDLALAKRNPSRMVVCLEPYIVTHPLSFSISGTAIGGIRETGCLFHSCRIFGALVSETVQLVPVFDQVFFGALDHWEHVLVGLRTV
jgi:hypothetical protein